MDGTNNNDTSINSNSMNRLNSNSSSSSNVRFNPPTSTYSTRRRSTQNQLINLSTISKSFSQFQRKSTSISFSGVNYVIDMLLDQNKAEMEAREAIQSGDEEKIEALRSSGDREKIGALIKVGLKSGNLELALDTLNMWKAEEWNTEDHCDLLHIAAQCGEINICKILVEQHNFSVSLFDTTGEETAIHYAAGKGHVQVIKYLHEQCNGDLNATYSKVILGQGLRFIVTIGLSSFATFLVIPTEVEIF